MGLIVAGKAIIDANFACATLVVVLELTLRSAVEHTSIVENVHAEVAVAAETCAIAVALFAGVGCFLST